MRSDALLLKLVYAVLWMLELWHGEAAFLYGTVLVALVGIQWLAEYDERLHLLDTGLTATFGCMLALGLFGWQGGPSILGVDKLFHTVAGVFVAYGARLGFSYIETYHPLPSFLATIAVGTVWEWFEWWLLVVGIDAQEVTMLLLSDTMLDIVFVTLGGAIYLAYDI
jgi:hypothetical protein